MKPYSVEYTNGSPTPSGGIVWSGEEIPCLDICPGQSINKTVFNIATKVCELAAPMDLSTLTLQCALDIFGNQETGNRTLASVLQLLIDNDCGLKELIDGIQAQVDGLSQDNLVLDLRCLAERDSFGNILPYDTESVLQSLINNLCDLETSVAGMGGKISDLQDQIDDLKELIPDGTEELIDVACIAEDKTIKEGIQELAEDYCNYKGTVGSTTDIQKAISQQCPELAESLKSVKGWETAPANMAESVNNLWIAFCNILGRVTTMENSCCAISCKDVAVGMEVIPSADGKAIFLKFSSGSGTDLPAGFVDKGSTVTFKDIDNKTLTYGITVEQDGTTDSLSMIGLNFNGPIDISVAALVGNDTLTCEKCLHSVFNPESGCPVCAITVTGKAGYVTIIYQTT